MMIMPQAPKAMSNFHYRLKTFNENWKLKGPLSPKKMAMAGFYYEGRLDNVKCYYCEKELEGWLADDDPYYEHKKHQPECPFIKLFNSSPTSVSVKEAFILEIGKLRFKLKTIHQARMKMLQCMQNEIENGKIGVLKKIKKRSSSCPFLR